MSPTTTFNDTSNGGVVHSERDPQGSITMLTTRVKTADFSHLIFGQLRVAMLRAFRYESHIHSMSCIPLFCFVLQVAQTTVALYRVLMVYLMPRWFGANERRRDEHMHLFVFDNIFPRQACPDITIMQGTEFKESGTRPARRQIAPHPPQVRYRINAHVSPDIAPFFLRQFFFCKLLFSHAGSPCTRIKFGRATQRFALLCGLLCIVTLPAFGAISVNARGTGTDATSGTTIAVLPNATIAAGSFGVLVLAIDNAGSGGATPASPTSFTDAKSNTWTRQINPIQDPAGASAGVELAFYTSPITTALLSSDSSTITFAGGVSVASSAWAFWEVVPTATFSIQYVTGAAGAGGSDNVPSVTTSSITSGDVVIGGGGAESADTWGGDADTTNGSWSTHQHTAAGTGTSGMSVTTQSKVVTATATQTYNPSLTAADRILGWVQLTETATPTGMGRRIIRM